MSIRGQIETARRMFTLPKDWKAKGNMEFDELLFLATTHKELAEMEICTRFNYWYREYCQLRIVITYMAAILFALIITCYLERYNITILSTAIVLAIVFVTCMYLIQRRARAIDDKLLHCYYWIIAEVLRPNKYVAHEHKIIEDVFVKNLPALEVEERKADKKFKRFLHNFGYTVETISN